MESQFKIVSNGTSVVQSDFNQLGGYALMDDYTFAELIRLAPYNGSSPDRAIFPFASSGGGGAVVAPNGATGQVLIRPFRAFVGSRTLLATDSKANWRDVRSGIWVGGATTLTGTVAISANAAGNPRWDLIYATVTPDVDSATVSRKVKNTTTHVIAAQNVVTTMTTTVVVQRVQGTPSGTPTFPATPADGGGSYNIPLAYVRVPNGFGAGSTVLTTDIDTAMPMATLRSGNDGSLAPANSQFGSPGGTGGLTTAQIQTWGGAGVRPGWFLPPDLSRGPSRIFALDLRAGSSAGWSHPHGTVLDNTVDWRNRYFKYTMFVGTGGGSYGEFASNPLAGGTAQPSAQFHATGTATAASVAVFHGMGQSFYDDTGGNAGIVSYVDATQMTSLGAASVISLRASLTTGNLVLSVSNVPAASLMVWLESTSQFNNF